MSASDDTPIDAADTLGDAVDGYVSDHGSQRKIKLDDVIDHQADTVAIFDPKRIGDDVDEEAWIQSDFSIPSGDWR